MLYLRQSTASQAVVIGPFVDPTTGDVEASLTINASDIRLSKNGANIVAKNSGGGTYDEVGMYTITLDATDTNTVGTLQLIVDHADALVVYHEFQVVEEAVYDRDYAASGLGYVANAPVNVAQISGDSTAADNLETAFDDTAGSVPWQGIVDQGTAQSATATTLVLRAAAAFTDDQLIGATILITGGTNGVGERRVITDYVQATDTATVDTWNTTPSGTITYKIFASAPASSAGTINANVTQISGDSAAADNLEAALDGNGGVTITAAITGNITGNLSGSVGSVSAIANNAITAAAIAADAGTEIAAAVLAAAAADPIDANVEQINTVSVVGDGSEGDKWRA